MSENEGNNNQDTTEEQVQPQTTAGTEVYRLSDDLIAIMRELIQLTILTGTNIVDHLRGVQVELKNGQVVPTEEYINAYNAYVEDLTQKAETAQKEAQQKQADDDSVN